MPQLFFGSRVWVISTWKWGAGSQVHKASWNAQVIAPGSHVLHAPVLVGTDGQGLDPAAPPGWLSPPPPMGVLRDLPQPEQGLFEWFPRYCLSLRPKNTCAQAWSVPSRGLRAKGEE